MSGLLSRIAALLLKGRGPHEPRICNEPGDGFARRIHFPRLPISTLFLTLLVTLVASTQAFAAPGEWNDFATVSMTDPQTPKLTNNGICWSDGTNILCDGTAGLASGGGTVADKIISGTTKVTANTTGYVSFTTGGTTTGYMDTAGNFILPGISTTGTVSAASVYAGGAGTSGSLIYRNASGTLAASSTFIVSGTQLLVGTNGSAGLGAYAIQAAGYIMGTTLQANGSVFVGSGLYWGGANAYLTGSNGTGYVNTLASQYIAFTTSSTEAMRIVSTGYVGIGTSTPTGIIGINGNSAQTIGLERSTSGAGGDLTIKAGGALSGATNTAGGNLTLASGIYTGTGSTGSNIYFQTPSNGSSGSADRTPATRMIISGYNGGVQVNTSFSPPADIFTVGGNTRLYSNVASGNIASLNYGALNGAGSQAVFAAVTGGITSKVSGNDQGYLDFYTMRSGTLTQAVRISASGDVGIGTVTPTTPLEVSGTVSATRFVGDGSLLTGVVASSNGDNITSGTTKVTANTTGYISFTTGGTTTGYMDTAGNFILPGVSTTGKISATGLYSNGAMLVNGSGTVSGALQVNGNIGAGNYTISNSRIYFNQAGVYNGTYIDTYNTVLYNLGGANAGGSGYGLTIRSGDSVGNSAANQNIGYISFQSDYGWASKSAARISAMVDGAASASSMPGRLMFFTTSSGTTTSVERMRIDSSGYVGVGVTPTTNLEVSGTVSATRFVGDGSLLTGIVASANGDNITSGTTKVTANTTGYVSFTTGGTTTGYMDTAGNFILPGVSTTAGISGTTGYFTSRIGVGAQPNSNYALYVSGQSLFTNNIFGTSGYKIGWDNFNYLVGDATAKNVAIYTSNTEALRIVSTGYVGIGTSTPAYTLDVTGNGRYTSTLYATRFSPLTTTGASGNSIYQAATNEMAFSTSNTEAMRIVSTGYVGIGTSTPSTNLEVSGTVSSSVGTFGSSVNIASQQTTYPIYVSASDARIALYGKGYLWTLGVGNGSSFPSRNFGIRNSSGSGNALVIASSTNYVGIGTDYPTAPLEVSGTVSATNFVGNGSGLTNIPAGTVSAGSSGSLIYRDANGLLTASSTFVVSESGSLGIGGAPSSVLGSYSLHAYGQLYAASNITTAGGDFNVSTAGHGLKWGGNATILGNATSQYINFNTSGTEAMRIVSTGYVGIGTSTPTSLLTVNGTVTSNNIRSANSYSNASNPFILNPAGASLAAGLFFPSAGTIGFSSGNNEIMRISGTGVAIGLVTPSVALEVSGTVSATGIRAAQGVSASTVYATAIGVGVAPVIAAGFPVLNVVADTGVFAPLNVANTNSTGYTYLTVSGTARTYGIGVGNASESGIGVANKFFVYDYTAGGTNMRMVIDSSGNMGVGTVNPNAKLEVAGAVSATALGVGAAPTLAQVQTSGGTNNTGAIFGSMALWGVPGYSDAAIGFNSYLDNSYVSRAVSTGIGAQIWLSGNAAGGSANALTFWTAASASAGAAQTLSERMRISGNGNVGIGVNSPTTALEVSGIVSGTTGQFNSVGAGLIAATGISITTNQTSVTTLYASRAVRFGNYGAGTLTTDASGNVTASSDERLKDIKGGFTRGLGAIAALNPIVYRWNARSGNDTSGTYAGFSAQDVAKAIPEAVGTDARGYLTLSDRPIEAALVNAVKELKAANDNLRADNDDLRKRLDSQQRDIDALKRQVGRP